ncbi:hypothetical protein EG329_006420 [Mollisiaceae sp. DMI_Dod_QoI]|nr:hypothetical protein EG329_006420 [Helotiales sp. DMI_Dod_QoI]
MGSEEVTSSDTSSADVAPDGDVIFLVGPEEHRLRVYSLILKNASKVFSAMLGPHFSEGQTLLQPNTPVISIPLPEDDFDSMVIICNILHGRNETFIEPLKPIQILNVAIAADKWDCGVPLAWAIKDWMISERYTDVKELWRLMLAAYLFGEAAAFAKITKALLFHHRGSYFELGEGNELESSVQMRIRILLEEARTKLRTDLLQAVFDAAYCAAGNCKCGWTGKCALSVLQAQKEALSPRRLMGKTVMEAIGIAEKLDVATSGWPETSCQLKLLHCTIDQIKNLLRNLASNLKERGGLTIESVHSQA